MIVYVFLAVAGAAMVAAGMWVWSAPAGLVTAGGELLAAAYIGAYVTVRAGEVR